MKVVIVGAGIAGLATGWRLAQAGAQVEIVERGLAGRGATWAAAGMLAATAELGAETTPLAAFAKQSRAAWPKFAAELESISGRRIGFSEDGALIVAPNEARALSLSARARALNANGVQARWLMPDELRAREPMLKSDLLGALWLPGEAQADNRVLAEALSIAYSRARGTLREHCEARALWREGERVVGVATAQGNIPADTVVLACGAWLNRMRGAEEDRLPVRPVKGQMAALVPPAGAMLPKALIWDEHIYLVPRRDRLFVGATVEEAGFDTSVTSEARNYLMAGAERLMALEGWSLAEMWAGLRPCAPDASPMLGPAEIPGLYIVNGQFRNGILFAPLAADVLSRLVLGDRADLGLRAFDPRRFAA